MSTLLFLSFSLSHHMFYSQGSRKLSHQPCLIQKWLSSDCELNPIYDPELYRCQKKPSHFSFAVAAFLPRPLVMYPISFLLANSALLQVLGMTQSQTVFSCLRWDYIHHAHQLCSSHSTTRLRATRASQINISSFQNTADIHLLYVSLAHYFFQQNQGFMLFCCSYL